MNRIVLLLLTTSAIISQDIYCPIENFVNYRTTYDIGDTLSIEDQNILFPVCNGADDYSTGDSFSFSDLNGTLNGGDYKITIISMNATW